MRAYFQTWQQQHSSTVKCKSSLLTNWLLSAGWHEPIDWLTDWLTLDDQSPNISHWLSLIQSVSEWEGEKMKRSTPECTVDANSNWSSPRATTWNGCRNVTLVRVACQSHVSQPSDAARQLLWRAWNVNELAKRVATCLNGKREARVMCVGYCSLRTGHLWRHKREKGT